MHPQAIGETVDTNVFKIPQKGCGSTSSLEHKGDLYLCLRPFLILGRGLAIIPIEGLFTINQYHLQHRLTFSWTSLGALTSIPISALLLINAVVCYSSLFKEFAGSGGGNASDMAFAVRDPIFYSFAAFVYIFFIFRSSKLIRLFETWRKTSSQLRFVEIDTKLFKHLNYTWIFLFSSGVFEECIFITKHFAPLLLNHTNTTEEEAYDYHQDDNSPLELFYNEAFPQWRSLKVPFSIGLSILLLLTHTLGTFGANFADIFLVLMSRALYYKFKILVDQTEAQLVDIGIIGTESYTVRQRKLDIVECHISTATTRTLWSWGQVRRDHLTLCKLLDEFETLLSPLIFASFSVNIFFVCLELHPGLTPEADRRVLDSTYASWSFGRIVIRILAISLTAAKINEYAHKIATFAQKCPNNQYCKEFERLERLLGTGPIGLSGLGCFVITRSFLLMLVSVIFTVEIVLLQATTTGRTV